MTGSKPGSRPKNGGKRKGAGRPKKAPPQAGEAQVEQEAKPRAAHRPTDYTPELADEICGLIARGDTFRVIAADEAMPDKSTMLRWIAKYPEFRDQYARACEVRTDVHAEEILDIADDSGFDVRAKEDGGYIIDGETVNRARLRIDSRKWLMSKLQPKKYGEKIALTRDLPDFSFLTLEQVEAVIAVLSAMPAPAKVIEHKA